MATWTNSQKNAIEIRNRRILVSAAAGSGKTATLVERIVGRILDKEDPINVDDLLVMTFTRAAAAEMRERILLRIEEELKNADKKSEIYERLKKQSILINLAKISTIDSFCLSLVKENIDLLKIDPSFKLANEEDLVLIKDEIIKDLLEEEYERADEDFMNFALAFSDAKNDKKIVKYIELLYYHAVTKAWPLEWFDEEILKIQNLDTSWTEALFSYINTNINSIINDIDRAIDVCMEDEVLENKYLPIFIEEKEYFKSILSSKDYYAQSKLIENMKFGSLKPAKGADEELKNIAKGIRDSYKDLIKKKIADVLTADESKIEIESENEREFLSVLLRLAKELYMRLSKKKLEKNICDFNDIEHFALEILWDKNKEKSNVAHEYAGRFKEIYIDEYQDSNNVQEELIKALDTENLFMVGDVKQSIYGFRQAKPELFNKKYKEFTDISNTKENLDTKIVFSKNFRSRESVLTSVNEIFMRIMGEASVGIEYNKEAMLNFGAGYFKDKDDKDGYTAKNTELLYVETKEKDKEDSTKEIEARLIAKRIKELTNPDKPLYINSKEGLRPLKYSDIVILLRSNAGYSDVFLNTLTDVGIPAYADVSGGYFDTLEIKRMLSILFVIDNPYENVNFATFLKSMIVGFEDIELADLTSYYKKNHDNDSLFNLYDACKFVKEKDSGGFIKENTIVKIKKALTFIEEYRNKESFLSISELISAIYANTGILDYVNAMPAGEVRKANLELLLEKARTYEETGYVGLFNFIRYIERIRKGSIDFGEASVLGENENVVRIMTIHKSKGLEFPVCFLSGMNKKFNKEDKKGAIIIDEDLGISSEFIDTKKMIKESSIKQNFIKEKIENDALAEELRVLYVAMTRAKELLIMTANISDFEKKYEKLAYIDTGNKAPISLTSLKKAGSYLDFFIMFKESLKGSIDFKKVDIEDLIKEEEIRQESSIELSKEVDKLKSIKNIELENVLNFKYKYEEDIFLDTKISISELKEKRMKGILADTGEELSFIRDENIDDIRKISPNNRGTIYHKFMELFDYKKISDENSLKIFKKELEEKNKMKKEELDIVKNADILAFMQSDLYQIMKKADESGKLKREVPFMLGLTAKELGISNSEELVLLRGIIDAYIDGEEIIIIDYKTDNIKKEEILKDRYELQLYYYAKALTMATGKKISKKFIYSFRLGNSITC